jgi:hypothetical protein
LRTALLGRLEPLRDGGRVNAAVVKDSLTTGTDGKSNHAAVRKSAIVAAGAAAA